MHVYVKLTQVAARPVVELKHENTGAVALRVAVMSSIVVAWFGTAVHQDVVANPPPPNASVVDVAPTPVMLPTQFVLPVPSVPADALGAAVETT